MTPEAASNAPLVHRGARHLRTQLDAVPGVPCPCGTARRGFAVPGNDLATIHLVDISADARTHYHRRMTEIYLVLEGEGFIDSTESLPSMVPSAIKAWTPAKTRRRVGRGFMVLVIV
jgi:hypothetical protein